MTSRIVRRLVFKTASFARRGMSFIAGMAIVARMPMMAITTISSNRVKPRSADLGSCSLPFTSSSLESPDALPLGVGDAVQAHSARQRMDVVDVLPAPRGGVDGVLIATDRPLVLAGHRIDREAAQELDLLVHLADQLDALVQVLELRRIPVGPQVDGDQPRVAVALVVVDGVPDLAQ